MSLINKMLQDLDARQARGAAPGTHLHDRVVAVRRVRVGHEWFWRTVTVLMLVAAAWTLWVIYNLQPRLIATELAYRSADTPGPTSGGSTSVAKLEVPSPPATAAGQSNASQAQQTIAASLSAPAPEKLAAPIEMLRLALTIDTPLAPRPKARESKRAAKPARAAPAPPAARTAPALAAPAPAQIEKRETEASVVGRAEREFRRAAQWLERGRVADAEAALRAALSADRTHQPARQTLIALLIEQERIDEAQRQLQDGLSVDPTHQPFAVAQARIHVDRGEFSEAFGVLERVGARGGSVDYHNLRGAVLQRLGRHPEAAEAYRAALAGAPERGASWVGLGISLDALGKSREAVEAFRRGAADPSLSGEAKAYADQRARQLR